jgi:ferric-dicitrate binding protein FerR (iron transport regulator)
MLAPFAPERRTVARIALTAALLAGLGWLAITLSSYFGHIALAS